MTGLTQPKPQDAVPVDGDAQGLLEQMGVAGELGVPALASAEALFQSVRSLPALRDFLQSYRAEILIPIELPVVLSAHAHACRSEVRELVALDRSLAELPELKKYSAASCRVGQRQLNRLRPLRDLRLVRRYRAAIEQGDAHGWHTIVYGLSLAVFSLPLRPGLAAYAHRTLGGFIEGAAGALRLNDRQCREAHVLAWEGVPEAMRGLLYSTRGLRLV
jgi:hypothetical protein